MTVLVAPVVGPLLGGWITDNISWPWIFYINIPVGLFAAGAHLVDLPQARPRAAPRAARLRRPGAAGAVGRRDADHDRQGQGARLVRLDPDRRRSRSSRSSASLFFLAWELTDKHPIVDLRLFARRNFLMGTLALSIAYGLFFGNVVLLPLWLQQYMGYTATWAGLATAPVGMLAIILSPWVGKNVGKIDPRKLATVAFIGFGAGAVDALALQRAGRLRAPS